MSLEQNIKAKLEADFPTAKFQLENESHNHSVAKNSETHFKLILVDDNFAGKSLLERHQIINQSLLKFFKSGLHALALHLFTGEEWQKKNPEDTASPICLGGSKSK